VSDPGRESVQRLLALSRGESESRIARWFMGPRTKMEAAQLALIVDIHRRVVRIEEVLGVEDS